MNSEKRILGIDYGSKRIGLAVSDPLGVIAQGLPTLNNISLPETIKQLQEIIVANNIVKLVVGFPLTMNGQHGAAVEQIDKFIARLCNHVNVPIVRWDERLTTVMAHRIAHEIGKSPSKNKSMIDQLSATLILQSYLDNTNTH